MSDKEILQKGSNIPPIQLVNRDGGENRGANIPVIQPVPTQPNAAPVANVQPDNQTAQQHGADPSN